jgi:hypothetical protein
MKYNHINSGKAAILCSDSGYSAIEILLCLAFIGITVSYTGSIAREQIERRALYAFSSKLSQGINGSFETTQHRGTEISILKNETHDSFIITSKGNTLLNIVFPKKHLTDVKIHSSITSREEIKIHPNGYSTPGRIELSSEKYLCVIRISMRGRVTNSCSKK